MNTYLVKKSVWYKKHITSTRYDFERLFLTEINSVKQVQCLCNVSPRQTSTMSVYAHVKQVQCMCMPTSNKYNVCICPRQTGTMSVYSHLK